MIRNKYIIYPKFNQKEKKLKKGKIMKVFSFKIPINCAVVLYSADQDRRDIPLSRILTSFLTKDCPL